MSSSAKPQIALALAVGLLVGGALGFFGSQSFATHREPTTLAPLERARVSVPEKGSRTAIPNSSTTDVPAARAGKQKAGPSTTTEKKQPSAPLASKAVVQQPVNREANLLRGSDEERLAAAREILAAGNRDGQAQRALEVMIELDPRGAVAELRRVAAGPREQGGGPKVTGSLIERLARTEGAMSNEDLASFFETGSAEVQATAASALGVRGDSSLVTAFLAARADALAGDDEPSRLTAMREIGEVRNPAATEVLVSALYDDSDEVRIAAVQSLSKHPRAVVIEELRPLLQDPSERVRRVTARAVESLESSKKTKRDGDRERAGTAEPIVPNRNTRRDGDRNRERDGAAEPVAPAKNRKRDGDSLREGNRRGGPNREDG